MNTLPDILRRFQQTLDSTVRRSGFAQEARDLQRLICDAQGFAQSDLLLIQTAGELLYATWGQIRVNELAKGCGLSPRQFERRFKQLTGFSPKTLARLIRFEVIRDRLLHEPALRSVDLAYDFGYTDQTHFIRDFKALAGWTPRAFVAAAIARSVTAFYYTPDPRLPYYQAIRD